MARFFWLALLVFSSASSSFAALAPVQKYSRDGLVLSPPEIVAYYNSQSLTVQCGGQDVPQIYSGGFIAVGGGYAARYTVSCSDGVRTGSSPVWGPSGRPSCPSNSSSNSSGTCDCSSGFVESGDACVVSDPDADLRAYCSSFKNSRREATVSQSGRDDPYTAFSSTCRVPQAYSPDGESTGIPMFPATNKGCAADFEYSWAGSDGNRNWTVYGYETTTGGTCTPGSSEGGSGGSEGGTGDDGEAPVTNDPNKFCDGYQGTVNGVSTCVPYASKTGSDGSSKTTNPDGTTEEKKTETTCSGTKCTTTTTTTTTDSSGNVSGVTVTVGDSTKDVYCDKNPKAAICKGDGDGEDGASFAGSCATEFTCKGDVLQCVIAKEQHKRACQLIDNEYDETKLYESSKGKTGDQTLELPGNRILDMNGPGMFKTDAIFGSGSCIQDLDVQVMDRTVQLPLSYLCPWVAELRYVLLGLGGLYWVMIVFGRR